MTPIVEETKKPQSMPTGPRNVLRSNDSASLWNCTLSPGWSREECDILRKALMKYGIGNWAQIIGSNCLPGKTNAQMNLQLQRMLGQQSTADRPSREEIKRRIQKNKELFEIPEEEWNKIELPKPEDVALNAKYEELRRLQDELANVQAQIVEIRKKKHEESQEIITNELNESSSIKEEVNSDNVKQRRSTRKSKKTRRS
ncbi:1807_t:CDS:2 [Funneliformis geosporum]|uniref:16462_t:CDS:1 n=1 Tax=Funneliformis geosporum TaxID=1117311 RepID=A0A9W4SFW7_9GLOM|nr:1807_t:CDS:2 [Funneliformis geosporum]CAI2165642.1 16462_t:CDS:2 [Funneliformis geosporum]